MSVVEDVRSSMMIYIPKNKVNHKMDLCLLKCARGSITNQDRQEINNSDWLQEEEVCY